MALADVVHEAQEPCALAYEAGIGSDVYVSISTACVTTSYLFCACVCASTIFFVYQNVIKLYTDGQNLS